MFGKKPESKALVPATPMELIAQAVKSDLDPDKLEKLMDLQERWVANQAKRDYGGALVGFQGDCPVIPCTKEVTGQKGFKYKYAPLDRIRADRQYGYGGNRQRTRALRLHPQSTHQPG